MTKLIIVWFTSTGDFVFVYWLWRRPLEVDIYITIWRQLYHWQEDKLTDSWDSCSLWHSVRTRRKSVDKIWWQGWKIRKGFKKLLEFFRVATTGGPKILIEVTKFLISNMILTTKVLEDYKELFLTCWSLLNDFSITCS